QQRQRGQAGRISVFRGNERVVAEAVAFHIGAGDDLQRALPGEIEERARQAGDAEIDIARYRGERDGLRAVERDELGVEAFGGEIAAVERDEERRARRRVQNADFDLFRGIRRQRG